jgi:hypothetical protein
VRRYAEQLPPPPEASPDDAGALRGWLAGLLAVTHRLNARNGRVFWDLTGVRVEDLSPYLAAAATECRDSRNRFAVTVTGSCGAPAAVPPRRRDGWWTPSRCSLSGFTTQSLADDLGRSPDEVAAVSTQVIEAALAQPS